MFSSTYDSNPFPIFPSSSYPTLPFYIDPENDFASNNNNTTTLLHDPLLVAPFIPSNAHHDAPPFPTEETVANLAVADCTAMLDQDASNGYGGLYSGVPNLLIQKPAIAKKDRHSKIHTSQGLRDRRVRLSSEIARKFFDLQDMLEFDKPSNTLEWLFTKSENAIKELARSKHSCSSGEKCSCDPSEPRGVVVHSSEKSMAGSSDSSSKGRKLKWAQREDACVQTKKESRDKARARARERTCYKMCNNNNNNNNGRLQDLEEKCPVTANTHQVLHQLRSSINQPELEAACARWPPQMVQPYPHLLGGEPAHGDGFKVIEESIMIKRNMMKPSLMSSDHHQNLAIPKEAGFNNINDYHSFPYSTPNWDTNENINGYSNFCGIATMNLSTCFMNPCFKIFGNSWEECTNQSRH